MSIFARGRCINLHVKISPIPPPPLTTPLLLYLPIAYSIYAEFSELETDVGKKRKKKESFRLFLRVSFTNAPVY